MLDFCNGDKEIFNKYMPELSKGLDNKQDIQKSYPKILSELESKVKAEYKKQMGGKTYEQHTNEYKAVCKKAIGTKDSAELAKNFVENAKQSAAYTEIGIKIATSMLLPGSSLVKGTTTKLIASMGEKAAYIEEIWPNLNSMDKEKNIKGLEAIKKYGTIQDIEKLDAS